MTDGFRYDFPHLGVEIEIPENLAIRLYNPPPMNTLNMGLGKFKPYRMVIDFDIFDRDEGDKGSQIRSSVILRVYFTKAEFDLAEQEIKIAFWNKELDPQDWEIISDKYTLFRQAQWTGRGISYFGYIEATYPDWGDPPIALGR